ncbi:MAG: hypothetical protein ACI841_003638, partial [Planctomycetota bacterium]
GEDGRFTGPAVNPAEGAIRLLAPGYQDFVTPPMSTKGGTTDFGRIALDQTRDLIVNFFGPVDMVGNLKAELEGSRRARSVPQDGRVVFQDVSPRSYRLIYFPSEGSKAFWTNLDLSRSNIGDWEVDIELEGGRELHVAVDGDNLPDLLWVSASYRDSAGNWHMDWADMFSHGDADFFNIDSDHVGIQVYDIKQNRLAVEQFDFSAGIDNPVQVDIPSESHELHIVDEDGEPVPNTYVNLYPTGELNGWGITFFGDEQGLVELTGLTQGEYLCRISIGQYSPCEYSIRLEGAESSRELELDRSGTLSIRAKVGGAPLQGYLCEVFNSTGVDYLGKSYGDGSGLAVLGQLQEADYQVRIVSPGVFIGPYPVRSHRDAAENHLSCRALGSLNVQLSGSPDDIGAAVLILRCRETGALVSEWMSQGAIATSPLTSTETGHILIAPIPEGSYDWRLDYGLDHSKEGQAMVSGTGQAILPIDL